MRTVFLRLLILIGGWSLGILPLGAGNVQFESLFGFGGYTGASPYGNLLQSPSGVLYGTTLKGGTNQSLDWGVVFSATTNVPVRWPDLPGKFTVLHSFTPEDGGEPYAGLTYSADGAFYGTTAFLARSNSLFGTGMGSLFCLRGTNFTTVYHFGSLVSLEGRPLDGASPRSPLVWSMDGNLFGTTFQGGENGYENGNLGFGTFFKISTNGDLTTLHSFLGPEGVNPTALTWGNDGILYGVASYGGANANVADTNGDIGFGTVFKVDTNGVVTTLYSFGTVTDSSGNPLDGAVPNSLVRGPDGAFYGTSLFGGSNSSIVDVQGQVGGGTVFRITTNGDYKLLYSFGTITNAAGVPVDGANPVGPLLAAPDGNLYGLTQRGGFTNLGTLFRMTTNGLLTTLFSFGAPNASGFSTATGGNPYSGLLLGADKKFYGTTSNGGIQQAGRGTLFRFGPVAPVILNPPRALTLLAGMTYAFAANVNTIFQTSFHWQHNGSDLTDGGNVSGSLTDNLQLTPVAMPDSGTYTLIASNFAGTAKGSGVLTVVPALISTQPAEAIIPAGATNTFTAVVTSIFPAQYQWQVNGTNLIDGGRISGASTTNLTISAATLADTGDYSLVVSNAAGVVQSTSASLQVEPFIVTSSPASLTVMAGATSVFSVGVQTIGPVTYQWQFNGTNLTNNTNVSGANGNSLTIASSQLLNSGTYSVVVSNEAGSGTASALLTVLAQSIPGCLITNLHSFTLAGDGGIPNGLLLASDGAFYGSTGGGGSNSVALGGNGNGTLFRFTTNGALSTLYSFTGGADFEGPSSPLVQDTNGLLYGTTTAVINNQSGTAFAATTNGLVTTLAGFYFTNGDSPVGVTLGTDGNLYGTAFYGGGGWGGVFRVNPSSLEFTNLVAFTGPGFYTAAPLTLGSDGAFYGSTMSLDRVAYSGGTLFRMASSGSLTTLFSFTNTLNGSRPVGRLLQTADGAWYGVTSAGGAHDLGTVFKFSPTDGFNSLYSFGSITNWDGSALDGASPIAGLTLGPDGNLYGSTYSGGYSNHGTIFRISSDGALQTLVWLSDNTGAKPTDPLVLGPDGNLYGTGLYGGTDDYGSIFRISIDWPLQIHLVSATGGRIQFAWITKPGRTYQVEVSTDSYGNSWEARGSSLVADAMQLIFSDAITNEHRFYRVHQLP